MPLPKIRRFFGLTLAFLSLGAFAQSKGGLSGSGGSGAACFPANVRVSQVLDREGKIKRAYRSRVTKTTTLEYWEYPVPYIRPAFSQSPQDYLLWVINSTVKPFTRYFADRLNTAVQLVNPNTWIDQSEGLPRAYDTGDIEPSALKRMAQENCVPVQLVLRQQTGLSNGQVTVTVYQDKFLIDKLGQENPLDPSVVTLQDAILTLHEALYTMGVQLGQQDSKSSRIFVAYILSGARWTDLQSLPPNLQAYAFRTRLYALGFDLYGQLFMPPLPPAASTPPHSQASLRRAYLDYMARAVPIERQALQNYANPTLNGSSYANQVMHRFWPDPLQPTSVSSELDLQNIQSKTEFDLIAKQALYPYLKSQPEETFIHFAVQEWAGQGIIDLDSLLFSPPDENLTAQQVHKACDFAQRFFSNLGNMSLPGNALMKSGNESMQDRLYPVLQYCQEW